MANSGMESKIDYNQISTSKQENQVISMLTITLIDVFENKQPKIGLVLCLMT